MQYRSVVRRFCDLQGALISWPTEESVLIPIIITVHDVFLATLEVIRQLYYFALIHNMPSL